LCCVVLCCVVLCCVVLCCVVLCCELLCQSDGGIRRRSIDAISRRKVLRRRQIRPLLAQCRVQPAHSLDRQVNSEDIEEQVVGDVQQRAWWELRTSVWSPRQGLGGQ
jgi:hypothetical protein